MKGVLESAKFALTGVETWFSKQLDACERQIRSLELRSGIGSLPDEILADVLEFVVQIPDEGGDQTGSDDIDSNVDYYTYRTIVIEARVATRLSQVCRRFRNLVILSPKLWRRICSMMNPGMASSCVSRCKRMDARFEVHLRIPFHSDRTLESFLLTAVGGSHFWSRFVHEWEILHVPLKDEITSTVLPLCGLHAPQLSEIVIGFPYEYYRDKSIAREVQGEMHYYSTWSTPSLHSMKTSNLIPVPFSGSISLSTLSIYMDLCKRYPGLDFKSLATFLGSCPVLEEFNLKIRDSLSEHESPVPQALPSRTEIKAVKKLELVFGYCDSSTISYFMEAVHFPNVSIASLRLLGDPDTHIQNFIQTMFPDSSAFPNLTRLQLTVKQTRDEWTHSHLTMQSVSIPFASLPKLEHLTLTLFDSVLTSLPKGTRLPALRSLEFVNCFNLDYRWIAEFRRNLMVQGVLRDALSITIDGIDVVQTVDAATGVKEDIRELLPSL